MKLNSILTSVWNFFFPKYESRTSQIMKEIQETKKDLDFILREHKRVIPLSDSKKFVNSHKKEIQKIPENKEILNWLKVAEQQKN